MAIASDLSKLPKADRKTGGWQPDSTPRFVQALAEHWAQENETAGDKPRATSDSRFRHSDAGGCSRAIAYAALNLPRSDPMDLTGTWNTRLGTLIHEAWQAVIADRYPDADIEPKVTSVDGDGSGHIDAVIPDGKRIAVELKTIGGFGFKMAVGERGEAQGPKSEHVAQAALNGRAVNADEIVVAYLSKEAISVAAAGRKKISELGRFCAEWTLQRDEYEPIAAAEEARIAGILGLLDEGTLPARKIPSSEVPAGAEITDPAKGIWQVVRDGQVLDAGSWWGCGYCRYQTMCSTTQAGRQPVEVVVQFGGVA